MARPEQVPHGWMRGRQFRILEDTPFYAEKGFFKNDLVKVVMVSRFGDCGVTKTLTAENGYNLRVHPKALVPVDQIPASVCEKCFYEREDHDEKCPEPVTLKAP